MRKPLLGLTFAVALLPGSLVGEPPETGTAIEAAFDIALSRPGEIPGLLRKYPALRGARLHGRTLLQEALRSPRGGMANRAVPSLLSAGVDALQPGEDGLSPLAWVLITGRTESLVGLAHHIAHVSPRTLHEPLLRDGRTALHLAAELGDVPATELLLALGAEPAARDRRGRTPLEIAARQGQRAMVYVLSRLGAPGGPAPRDVESARALVADRAVVRPTPLPPRVWGPSRLVTSEARSLVSAAHDRGPHFEDLLARHPDLVTLRGEGGRTLLHEAVQSRMPARLEALVKKGAPLDATDDEGVTVLGAAARVAGKELIPGLLALGALPTVADFDASTESELPGKLPLLYEASPEVGNAWFLRALEQGRPPGRFLQEVPALGNVLLPTGERPAHALLRVGYLTRFGDLRGTGVDFGLPDAGGSPVAHRVIELRDRAYLRYLPPTALEATDRQGRTALHAAIDVGDRDTVDGVLGAAVRLDPRDRSGRTPLRHAVDSRRRDLVAALVALGADPLLPDAMGRPSQAAEPELQVVLDSAPARFTEETVWGAIARREPGIVGRILRQRRDLAKPDLLDVVVTCARLDAPEAEMKPVAEAVLTYAPPGAEALRGVARSSQVWLLDLLLEERFGIVVDRVDLFFVASPSVAARLLEKGMYPNVEKAGRTRLHMAVQGNDLELARVLLDHGANPNALDDHGNSPLPAAGPEMRALLLARGADPRQRGPMTEDEGKRIDRRAHEIGYRLGRTIRTAAGVVQLGAPLAFFLLAVYATLLLTAWRGEPADALRGCWLLAAGFLMFLGAGAFALLTPATAGRLARRGGSLLVGCLGLVAAAVGLVRVVQASRRSGPRRDQ